MDINKNKYSICTIVFNNTYTWIDGKGFWSWVGERKDEGTIVTAEFNKASCKRVIHT